MKMLSETKNLANCAFNNLRMLEDICFNANVFLSNDETSIPRKVHEIKKFISTIVLDDKNGLTSSVKGATGVFYDESHSPAILQKHFPNTKDFLDHLEQFIKKLEDLRKDLREGLYSEIYSFQKPISDDNDLWDHDKMVRLNELVFLFTQHTSVAYNNLVIITAILGEMILW